MLILYSLMLFIIHYFAWLLFTIIRFADIILHYLHYFLFRPPMPDAFRPRLWRLCLPCCRVRLIFWFICSFRLSFILILCPWFWRWFILMFDPDYDLFRCCLMMFDACFDIFYLLLMMLMIRWLFAIIIIAWLSFMFLPHAFLMSPALFYFFSMPDPDPLSFLMPDIIHYYFAFMPDISPWYYLFDAFVSFCLLIFVSILFWCLLDIDPDPPAHSLLPDVLIFIDLIPDVLMILFSFDIFFLIDVLFFSMSVPVRHYSDADPSFYFCFDVLFWFWCSDEISILLSIFIFFHAWSYSCSLLFISPFDFSLFHCLFTWFWFFYLLIAHLLPAIWCCCWFSIILRLSTIFCWSHACYFVLSIMPWCPWCTRYFVPFCLTSLPDVDVLRAMILPDALMFWSWWCLIIIIFRCLMPSLLSIRLTLILTLIWLLLFIIIIHTIIFFFTIIILIFHLSFDYYFSLFISILFHYSCLMPDICRLPLPDFWCFIFISICLPLVSMPMFRSWCFDDYLMSPLTIFWCSDDDAYLYYLYYALLFLCWSITYVERAIARYIYLCWSVAIDIAKIWRGGDMR